MAIMSGDYGNRLDVFRALYIAFLFRVKCTLVDKFRQTECAKKIFKIRFALCAGVISQSSEGRLVIHRAHFFVDRRAEKRKGKTSHEVSGTVLDARCRSI